MQDSELIHAFLTESSEILDDAEPKLIELQRAAEGLAELDPEIVNSIFRAFHSTKGSAGFLQLNNISAITHSAETLLDRFRKGKTKPNSAHIAVLLNTTDLIRKLLAAVEDTNSDEGFEEDVKTLVDSLNVILNQADEPRSEAEPQAEATPAKTELTEAQKAEMLIVEDDPNPQAAPEQGDAPRPAAVIVSSDMVSVFAADAEELLESAEQSLLGIEKTPDNTRELVLEILRALHTFKGNCGLMELRDMERLGHKLETAWQCVRDGEAQLGPDTIKLTLKMVDLFRKTVGSLTRGGKGNIPAFPGFSDLLDELIPAEFRAENAPPPPKAPATADARGQDKPDAKPAPAHEKTQAARDAEQSLKAATSSPAAAVSTAARTVRVSVDKLDHLNNLIGELVIAEDMVTRNEDLRRLRLENFERASHQLRLIASELRDLAMSLRMIPLEATMRKMIRLVHDLSMKAGKKVDLQLAGVETEVDRTVAELISDPLVHMVRNAVDHGIEKPEDRIKAGKPEVGVLRLEAKHQSGEVWIVMKDDGRGLDRDKILAKATERGLIDPNANLADEEIYNLIFLPGFSTADKVTDVSGRGVGMDVVKRNLERIRGRVDIASEKGKGTTLTIRIPLTLAIIQGMLLRVGSERYIVPLLAIRESVKPTRQMLNTVVGRGEMLSIRGDLLPLFRLSRLFGTKDAVQNPEDGIALIVEDGRSRAALLVDDLLGQQQTVVKSMNDVLGDIQGVSGVSILSDGRAGLILDVGGLVKMANS